MQYPAVRYTVDGGKLLSEVIQGPDGERPGWLASPHVFRALSVAELLREGKSPEEALRLHQRELNRVALIYSGRSIEEAERLADTVQMVKPEVKEQEAPATPTSELRAAVVKLGEQLKQAQATIAEREAAIAAKQAEMTEMAERFESNWQKLTGERDRYKAKLTKKGVSVTAETDTPDRE